MILLVDDNEHILKILESILGSHGYKTIKAKNGREAYDLIVKYGPAIELMLLDLLMPELNGVDLLDILQNQDIKVPTIVLTGYINEIKDADKYKPLAILSKPFHHSQLIHEVEEGLKCRIT